MSQSGKTNYVLSSIILILHISNLTYSGTVERRWIAFNESKAEAMIAMRAVSLIREQNNLNVENSSLSEQMVSIHLEWAENLNKHGELGMRDIILKSICPDVYGMFPVKLAIVLAICSGNDVGDLKSSDGLHQRGQSHILLVGDPGLAKSKLLLSAVSIAPRAVHTTGMGCSSAGLTAAAIKVSNAVTINLATGFQVSKRFEVMIIVNL